VSSDAVSLRRGDASAMVCTVADRARAAVPDDRPPDLAAAIGVAADLGPRLPMPTQGNTLTLWEALATLGAVDLTVARVAEPHLDALAILREARRQEQIDEEAWQAHSPSWSAARLWQVYAAEGSERLTATQHDDGWRLTGVKPWCSLAERATHALITAWAGDERRLFAVDLFQEGVRRPDEGTFAGQSATWASRGLAQVRSTALTFDSVRAVSVGGPDWYLTRPGFAWGGAGVAAIWYGAGTELARTLRRAASDRPPDQVALLHLGAVDTALARARAVLLEAAVVADDHAGRTPAGRTPAGRTPTGGDPAGEAVLVCQRVRQVVADSAEEILSRVGHALGPAPLTGDESHARRVADLTVYLRQHHAERDLARQGAMVLDSKEGWRW
jgi:alkylation response protein AidB-like acyl-CoA dehydrogenase